MKISNLVGFILPIIIIIILYPQLHAEINTLELSGPSKTIVSFTPVMIVAFLILSFISILHGSKAIPDDEAAYYLDQDDIAVEPKTLTIRDAKKILKIRYAKGDIDSFEYTERMSRL